MQKLKKERFKFNETDEVYIINIIIINQTS